MNKMSVGLFAHRDDAEPLRQRLAENGVDARITPGQPEGYVRLEVPANDFGRAYDWLVDWDAREGILKHAIRCPECRSLRIDYPQFTHKSLGPNFVVVFLSWIGLIEKEFYCQDCHYTWPREGTKPSLTRPHSAPYYFIEGVPQTEQRPHSA